MQLRTKYLPAYFSLPLTGAVLLFIAWPPNNFPAAAFIALLPFMLLDEIFRIKKLQFFAAVFTGFFAFHLMAAWWMYSSTIMGSLLAHLFNAAYMAIVLLLYQHFKSKTGNAFANLFVLPSLWLAFEYLHFHWELAWPWFTLGHLFAENPGWVQWYSLTGSLGGSLWVLMVNGLLATGLSHWLKKPSPKAFLWPAAGVVLVLIPLLLSYKTIQVPKSHQKLEVLIVQPNIDPRTEKFNGMLFDAQILRAQSLIGKGFHEGVELVVLPETYFTNPLEVDSLAGLLLRERLLDTNKTALISGIFTKISHSIPTQDRNAVIHAHEGTYVLYNSLLFADKNGIQLYHKTKLVPLVEKQPFYQIMKPLRQYIERSGGFFGSYGTYNDQFIFKMDNYAISPLICFESAFGDYAAHSAARGTNLIVLVTNDGWWSSPGGYRQHLAYARLRAIETGRTVVRAANTGVSAIISPDGSIQQSLAYGTEGTLVGHAALHSHRTFYSRNGDFIGISALFAAVLLLLVSLYRFFRKLAFRK